MTHACVPVFFFVSFPPFFFPARACAYRVLTSARDSMLCPIYVLTWALFTFCRHPEVPATDALACPDELCTDGEVKVGQCRCHPKGSIGGKRGTKVCCFVVFFRCFLMGFTPSKHKRRG